MRYRLRTLLILACLIPVPIAVFSASFMTVPLRQSDKTDAAQRLIAWIVEEQPLPGFGEGAADAHWFRKKNSLLMACDFVPSNTQLSDDRRVHRVTREEFESAVASPDFETTAYIDVVLKVESPRLLVLEVSYYHGTLGAQGYRFEFRRKVWGLRARGKLMWVS